MRFLNVCVNVNIYFIYFITQELSKIAMPVIFNEPLSFLQRLTEYMEHTYLIHQANASTDSIQRMKVAPSLYCKNHWAAKHEYFCSDVLNRDINNL